MYERVDGNVRVPRPPFNSGAFVPPDAIELKRRKVTDDSCWLSFHALAQLVYQNSRDCVDTRLLWSTLLTTRVTPPLAAWFETIATGMTE